MLSRLLSRSANQFGENIALECGEQKYTYNQLNQIVDTLSAHLLELGIVQGDRVAFFLPDSVEEILLYFACFQVGAIAVPLYEGLRGHDLAGIIKAVAPTVLVSSNKLLPYISKINNNIPMIKWIYTIDKQSNNESVKLFSSLLTAKEFVAPQVCEEAIATIFFTSGSTGKPKGAMHAHKNIRCAYQSVAASLNFSDADRALLSHIDFASSLFSMLLPIIFVGGTCVLLTDLTAETELDYFINKGITMHFRVPCFWDQVITLGKNKSFSHQLRFCLIGGDVIPASIYQRFKEVFKIPLTASMGMTETTFQTINCSEDASKLGSVGKPLGHVELKIVDDDGNVLGPNEVGELLVKSPGSMVGYWNDPAQTQKTMSDGWLHSGDLGYLDEDGYFWFVDRKKNIIVGKLGANISPAAVESVLVSHDDVEEAVVVGIKNGQMQETVCAFVKSKCGRQVDCEELIGYAKSELADYKVPGQIEIVDEFPVNARGKIDRFALKAMVESH